MADNEIENYQLNIDDEINEDGPGSFYFTFSNMENLDAMTNKNKS